MKQVKDDMLHVALSKELKEYLKVLAQRDNRTLSSFVTNELAKLAQKKDV